MKRALLLLGLSLIAACDGGDEETLYEQFNSKDDTLQVEVGVTERLEARETELYSNTGQTFIGLASVDSGGVPAGEIIRLVVEVDDAYEHIVDRVTVRVDSGERGEDEYEMEADLADEGLYVLELQAVADEGEQRTDTFTLRLWDLIGDNDGEGSSSAQDTDAS